MQHYAAFVQCAMCGHKFSVCVHTRRPPDASKEYVVMCPENGSVVRVPADALRPMEACPEGATVVREGRT